MEQAYAYRLSVTAPGGGETRDVTALTQSITWSGDIRQTARELRSALVIPRDGSVEAPPLEEGAWLTQQAAVAHNAPYHPALPYKKQFLRTLGRARPVARIQPARFA